MNDGDDENASWCCAVCKAGGPSRPDRTLLVRCRSSFALWSPTTESAGNVFHKLAHHGPRQVTLTAGDRGSQATCKIKVDGNGFGLNLAGTDESVAFHRRNSQVTVLLFLHKNSLRVRTRKAESNERPSVHEGDGGAKLYAIMSGLHECPEIWVPFKPVKLQQNQNPKSDFPVRTCTKL